MSERVKKWTEGEWVSSGYCIYGRVDGAPKSIGITRMERWKSKRPIEEILANAHLMAASKNLVEALEDLLGEYEPFLRFASMNSPNEDSRDPESPALKRAKAALAMAYGETQ